MEASSVQRHMQASRGSLNGQEAMQPSNLQRYTRKEAPKLLKKKANTVTFQETLTFRRLKKEIEK